jgi:hypothetical protein
MSVPHRVSAPAAPPASLAAVGDRAEERIASLLAGER